MLDKRINAFREDLADIRLKGRVEAARFVEGEPGIVVAPLAPLRRAPADDSALETQALLGETLLVFERDAHGWCFVQLCGDDYVGYMPADAIGEPAEAPTHEVSVPSTFVFPGPDIKRPPLETLPMGGRVAALAEAEDHNATYRLVAPSGAVVARHLRPLGERSTDFVSVAERFLGTPYLWGGKSVLGVDCSGLVQVSLAMAGIAAPRDTDLQARDLGRPLAHEEGLRRGDLVFWQGHVGILLDADMLLHANAFHMMTAAEPLGLAVIRLGARGAPVTSIRRLEGLSA